MENQQHQKVVITSYLAVAGLVFFLVQYGLFHVKDAYDLESKIKSIEYIVRGFSVALGLATFFALFLNSKVNTFMDEVAVELFTRVSWPTGKETWTATGIVLVTVLIAGVVLSVLDWLFSMALKSFI